MGKRGKQNRHALRHGIETTNLPRELAYYDRAKEIFRRRLEDAVLEVKGCMTLRENTRIIAASLRYRNFKMRGAKLRRLFDEDMVDTIEWWDFLDKQVSDVEKIADHVAKLPLDKDDKGLIIETLYNEVQQSESQCGAALPAEFTAQPDTAATT